MKNFHGSIHQRKTRKNTTILIFVKPYHREIHEYTD